MNITLLNKVVSTKPTKTGKTYQLIEVAYKNNTYEGKIEGFKVTQYMKGFNDIANAAVGDTLDVEVKKGDTGFNEWVSAVKGGVNEKQTATAVNIKPMQGYKTETKSNYETTEERAKRQVYIIRQSSVSAAVATLSVGAKAVKPDDVIAVAKQYESYVLGTGATGFDDFPDVPDEFIQDAKVE